MIRAATARLLRGYARLAGRAAVWLRWDRLSWHATHAHVRSLLIEHGEPDW